ncbi:hypothetical protein SCB49_09980 [unidentified eubacterium SCB49]|nr:hypothetical protein SCB49_09980 [unidentified eubacterium SCB49]
MLLFIPIGITVHLAEKIDKILDNEVPFNAVAIYFLEFTVYFANLLFPLFLFLSVIWFTSKLANNTEVIAFLSSGVSYYRFLRPFMIGATIIFVLGLGLTLYLAPLASTGYNEFTYKYLVRKKDRDKGNIFRQINDNDYIYVSYFNTLDNSGSHFTLEHFEEEKLVYKISANRIRYNEKDSTYTLQSYKKRTIGVNDDILESRASLDTTFSFKLEDLTPVKYIAETLNYSKLNSYIEQEKERGSSYINRYVLEKYKRFSIPFSVFILTIIAVSVSSVKRRGGMGANLAIGIGIGMIFVFFDKIFGTLAQQSDFSPLVATWFPNVIFAILAIYLLRNAKR